MHQSRALAQWFMENRKEEKEKETVLFFGRKKKKYQTEEALEKTFHFIKNLNNFFSSIICT